MKKSKRNISRRKLRNKKYNKKNRSSKKRVSNKRRGGMSGIALKEESLDTNEAFKLFLINSKIKYLSKGSFGTTFIATLNDPFIPNSPYKSTDAETYGQPVPTIIIKLAMLETPDDKTAFNNEINIQKEIYSKTMEYLEPICPAIVYSNIYKRREKTSILNQIKSSMYDRRSISDLVEFIDYEYGVGIIAMEFAYGYHTLHSLQYDPNYKLYKEMIMFLLLELALKTGYSHADFHGGNLMINASSTTYFKKTNPTEPSIIGKPLLIDFGMTNKIPSKILNTMKEHCVKEEYTKALHYLCDVDRMDGLSMTEYPSYYGWVCGSVDPNMNMDQIEEEIDKRVKNKEGTRDQVFKKMADISNMRFAPDTNEKIKLLFKQRENAIQDLVKTFNPTHIGGPQLPLTEKGKEYVIESIESPTSSVSLAVSPSTSSTSSSPVDLDFSDKVSQTSTPNSSIPNSSSPNSSIPNSSSPNSSIPNSSSPNSSIPNSSIPNSSIPNSSSSEGIFAMSP
jgi:hypothetical protein